MVAQPFDRGEMYSRQDSLRGSNTPERAWWDLRHYRLAVWVYPEKQEIEGVNTITYVVKSDHPGRLQIELQKPMVLEQAVQNGKSLSWDQEGMIYFIQLQDEQPVGSRQELALTFGGKPKKARRAPWDGGFSWTKDDEGNHFIATSNQGEGSSVWWPSKDHPLDEPEEGITEIFTVPQGLVAVGNGRLTKTERDRKNKQVTYTWEVTNPINDYGININIGDYVNWTETYAGEKGDLECSYWALRQNEAEAREQFKQGSMTLEAMEHWFGPYPFYEDTYKLVHVPYLGMEHQSSVTYGNNFGNGYLGRDLSQTGVGLQFDFIIVHESGHEWFANNITHQDVADMWIHESFTNYSESLFVEYHFGKESGWKYVRGTRSNISNDIPIIGPYNVRREGSGDMYYKGGNMLHTIRQIINDDEKWRSILRGLNEDYYHQTVTSQMVEDYIAEKSGEFLEPVFDLYLRDVRVPTFSYRQTPNGTQYRWSNVPQDFIMPLDIMVNGEERRIIPTYRWQMLEDVTWDDELEASVDYYIYQEDQTVR